MWREILKAFNPLADEGELDDDVNYRTVLYNMLKESEFLDAVRDFEDAGMRFYAKVGENYNIRKYLFNSLWAYKTNLYYRVLYANTSVFKDTNPRQNDALKVSLGLLKNNSERKNNITDDIPFYYIYNAVSRIITYLTDVVNSGQTHRLRNVRGGFKSEQLPEKIPWPQSFNQLLEKVKRTGVTFMEEIGVLIRQYANDVGKEHNETFRNNIFKMVNVRDARDARFIGVLEQVTDMWIDFLEETHEEENDKRILGEIYSNARKGIFKYEIDDEIGVPYFAVAEHLVSLRKDDVKFQDEEDYQTRLEGILNVIYSGFRLLLLDKFKKESDTIKEKWSTPLYSMIYNSSNRWKDLLKAFDPLDDTLEDFDEVDEKDLRTFVNQSFASLRKNYMTRLRNVISSSNALTFIKRIFNFGNAVIDDFTFTIIHGGYVGHIKRFELPENLPDADKEYHFKMPFSRAFRNFNLFWNEVAEQLGLLDFDDEVRGFIEIDNLRIDWNDWKILGLEVEEELFKLMDKYSEDRKKIEQEIKDRESE
jgi:hypothetical protein